MEDEPRRATRFWFFGISGFRDELGQTLDSDLEAGRVGEPDLRAGRLAPRHSRGDRRDRRDADGQGIETQDGV